MVVQIKIFKDNKEMAKFSMINGPNLGDSIKIAIDNKVFAYIKKELYKNFDEVTKKFIDSNDFSTQMESTEFNTQERIQEILSKDVVFVKYNNEEEIKEIQEMRNILLNTDDSFYVVISELEKEYK